MHISKRQPVEKQDPQAKAKTEDAQRVQEEVIITVLDPAPGIPAHSIFRNTFSSVSL